MGRYISREMQRTLAELLIAADCTDDQLAKASVKLEQRNGTPPTAFNAYVEKHVHDRG